MRVLFASFVLLAGLATSPVMTADCDCKHWPWPKECKDTCNARLLNTATKPELTSTLKIPDATADKIIDGRREEKLKTIDDLKGILTSDELRTVRDRVDKTNKRAVDSIMKDAPKGESSKM